MRMAVFEAPWSRFRLTLSAVSREGIPPQGVPAAPGEDSFEPGDRAVGHGAAESVPVRRSPFTTVSPVWRGTRRSLSPPSAPVLHLGRSHARPADGRVAARAHARVRLLGRCPALAVPDNARTGVSKAHCYDPDGQATRTAAISERELRPGFRILF